MHTELTSNLRVENIEPLIAPDELKQAFPLGNAAAAFVATARSEIEGVLHGRDPRRLVIVGPCSIHDPTAALEYAERLSRVRAELADALLICMRVYFEKPRTTVGWKGLINDPHLDGSCDVAAGLRMARSLLLDLARRGMPAATETLDPLAPQYLADLMAWTAIGARTDREPDAPRDGLGAIDAGRLQERHRRRPRDRDQRACRRRRAPHSFIGIDGKGRAGVVRTRGNPHTHLVLRGGRGRPNYREADVVAASETLRAAGQYPRVLIDCSHDNSGKNHEQPSRAWSPRWRASSRAAQSRCWA